MADTPSVVKSGYTSSEFALTLLFVVLTAISGSGMIGSTTPVGKLLSIALAALTVLGYSVSRGMVKAAAHTAAAGRSSGK